MSLFIKGSFGSFIIPRGQKHKLTIAQKEQTGPSNEIRSRGRPVKCKFTMGEIEQPRPSNVAMRIKSARTTRALKKYLK